MEPVSQNCILKIAHKKFYNQKQSKTAKEKKKNSI